MRKLRKGFTIVELVIVIAVIAVLTAILVPTFIHLAKKAKESSDKSLVHNLNTALQVDISDGQDKPETMQDAVDALIRQGYIVPQLATKSGQDLVYNIDANEFYLSGDVTGNHLDYWHIEKSMPTVQDWSIYAYDWPSTTKSVSNLTVGFDAGNVRLDSISYARSSQDAAQTVLIRTNSADTELIIDAPNDTVKHHDDIGKVHVISVDSQNCYEEHGSAAFTQVDSGKYKTTASADVELLFISDASSVSLEIASGTVDHAHASSEEEASTLNANSQGVIFDYDGNGAQEGLDVHNHFEEENYIELASDYETNKTNEAVVEAVDKLAGEEIADDPNLASYQARIGAVGYSTLQAAWNAGKGKTVVLLKDLEQNVFYAYGNYSLDLNGHALTLRGHSAVSGAFGTDGGANYDHTNLTIKNGILNLNGAGYSTYGIYNYGTLTLKDLTINSACQTVIYSIGQQWGTAGVTTLDNVTINSTHSSGTAVAVYAYKSPWAGNVKPSVVIKNSKVLAAYNAVMMYGVDATVENCEISAENNNALWISNSATGSGITGTITVKGNTSISAGSDYKRLNAASGHSIVVVAGTYNFDPSNCNSKNYVDSESYDVTDNGDGTWTISAK